VLKRIARCGLLGLAMSAGQPVRAEQAIPPPANPDECLKLAYDLAHAAEQRKLAEAVGEQAEALVSKIEGQCDANQFPEASATALELQRLIERGR